MQLTDTEQHAVRIVQDGGPVHRWQNQAECLGLDVNVFYPTIKRGDTTNHYVEAKKICAACPVVAECLADALLEESRRPARTYDECHGYRGDATPSRRADLVALLGLTAGKDELFMRKKLMADGRVLHRPAKSYEERIMYGYEARTGIERDPDSPWEVDHRKRQARKVS